MRGHHGHELDDIGEAIVLIVECAFTPKAAFGGAVGSDLLMALQFGCAWLVLQRVGFGHHSIVAAAARDEKNPAEQASSP